MNFALAVILSYLTVACNGQFKIIGLLDTKTDGNNGTLGKIRSFDVVTETNVQSKDDLQEGRGLTETIINGVVDVKQNVNFIKPYDVTTNDVKNDFVQVTSEGSSLLDAIKVVVLDENVQNGNLNEKNVSDSEDLKQFSDEKVKPATKSPTTRATSSPKAYRKSFQPNIRKFAYIEARNFHHPDSSNNVTPSNRWNHKFIKVLKYRNKYKSKCRCERIWNCPKIQMSIHRCEPDYYMCCF